MVWNLGCSLFFRRLEVSVQFRDKKNFGGKILALAGWGWCGDLDGLNGGVDCGFKAVNGVLKILLGPLYFAKLSFSEVDGYFLFFLYSAIASARRCSQPALSSKNLL